MLVYFSFLVSNITLNKTKNNLLLYFLYRVYKVIINKATEFPNVRNILRIFLENCDRFLFA